MCCVFCEWVCVWGGAEEPVSRPTQLKGVLDKYNIYLFTPDSIENFKPLPKFSADSANAF